MVIWIETPSRNGEHIFHAGSDSRLNVAHLDGAAQLMNRIHGGTAETIHHLGACLHRDSRQNG